MTEPSRRPLTDALIPELEKLWEDASGRAEYVEISMIALDARDLARELAEAKRALSDASGLRTCAACGAHSAPVEGEAFDGCPMCGGEFVPCQSQEADRGR